VRSSRGRTLGIILAIVVLVAVLAAATVFRPTIVPNLVFKQSEDASQLLADAGLKVGVASLVATTASGEGIVLAQSPVPNSRSRRGRSVDVTVSVTPTPTAVPNVEGLLEEAAVQQLQELLFIPISVPVYHAEKPVGVVLDQAPKEGQTWLTGKPVAITVCAGPDNGSAAKVPDLEGVPLEEAMSKLDKAGLAGYVVVRDLADPQANVVQAQFPAGGTLVNPGQTVLLYFTMP
jgi:serine/threonine-protein kinase